MSGRFSLKDFGSRIPIDSVIEWLRRAEWSVKPDGKDGLLCAGPLDDHKKPITRTLPKNENYADYELRLEDLIATLATVLERPAIEIVHEMASPMKPVGEVSSGPFAVEALITVVEGATGSGLSGEQRQEIVRELTPALRNAELAADVAGPFGGNTIRAVALLAARLAELVPSGEAAKLALWRICSRLLANRLVLTPDQLDEFYAIAAADRPVDPENTYVWLHEHLPQQEDEEVETDPRTP